jgi:hypothetical protein
MPFIIMNYMQSHLRSLPEPILTMESVLTAQDNKMQDLCTFVNRVYARKDPSDDTVDLYDVMPKFFKKGELEVILEDKVFTSSATFPCTSIDHIRKLQFGIAYLNVEKTSWANSFIKFRVNDRAGTGVKILYLLIKSERHAIEKDCFRDLANDVQNNLKSGEAVRHLYISDAIIVPPEQDFKWAIIIDGSKRMEYDGKCRYALRHLRYRRHPKVHTTLSLNYNTIFIID